MMNKNNASELELSPTRQNRSCEWTLALQRALSLL